MLENLLTLYPEYTKWYGPTFHEGEGRYYIYLFRSGKVRSSLSFARALMECKLNRRLTKDEEVDHIDNDKENDSIDNLQVLTGASNKKKSNSLGWTTLVCPECNKDYKKEQFRINQAKAIGKKNLFCSRYCVGRFNRRKFLERQ